MARMHLYLPSHLKNRAQAELGDEFNYSALLQEALEARLDLSSSCSHRTKRCTSCGSTGETSATG